LEDRRFSFAQTRSAGARDERIVEPEMDMKREGLRPGAFAARISKIMRWLMPDSQQVAPPMRSVARELEEAFPARDN
jgi:hypothetical protein